MAISDSNAIEGPTMKSITSGPIQRISLKTRVSGLIREAILSGKLRPGARIIELKLAESLGIGTTAVREALFELESAGFVTRVANKGTFVTRLNRSDIEQIFQVRRELEVLAVRLLEEQSAGEAAPTLFDCVQKMREAAEARDLRKFYTADLEFHRTIWRLAGNKYLEKALDGMVAPMFAYFAIMNQQASTLDLLTNAERHSSLVQALLDGAGAAEQMRAQMQFSAGREWDALFESAPEESALHAGERAGGF